MLVGTVTGTDPDTNDTLSYSITAGNDGAFDIDSSSGAITIDDSDMLDSATTPTYWLTVQVSDGDLTDTATVTINVLPKPIVNVTAVDPTASEMEPNDYGQFMFALAGGPLSRDVTVTYTINGTATITDDYSLSGSSEAITIPAGYAYAFLHVYAVNDAPKQDPDEQVDLVLIDSPGEDYKSGSSDSASVVISEDDYYPRVSITGAAVIEEGDDEPMTAIFTVSLIAGSGGSGIQYPVGVNFSTFDGTATLADNDYNALYTTLTFVGGEIDKTVTVTVNGDEIEEDDEHFYAQLSNPSNNAILGNALRLGTTSESPRLRPRRNRQNSMPWKTRPPKRMYHIRTTMRRRRI